jgi:hypothetical protein
MALGFTQLLTEISTISESKARSARDMATVRNVHIICRVMATSNDTLARGALHCMWKIIVSMLNISDMAAV